MQLTLLLDKGPDAQDTRFVPDSQHHRYNSLPDLLNAVDEKRLCCWAAPRQRQDHAAAPLAVGASVAGGLKAASGQTSLLAPLSGCASKVPGRAAARTGAVVGEPVAGVMQQHHPTLPAFATMLQQGRLLLLLDGLNEIPHQDKTEYRARIEQWRQFLHETRTVATPSSLAAAAWITALR
ncbi:MAG: hypothetical protein IPK53_12445 [bacterium]|nr:hypothetical protein [bacterium]